MKEHLKLLGYRVRDVVTNFEGVVTSIGFDLYCCVQAIVSPEQDKKTGKVEESRWFDTKRLSKLSKTPVMAIPTFEVVPGGQDKPGFTSNPVR